MVDNPKEMNKDQAKAKAQRLLNAYPRRNGEELPTRLALPRARVLVVDDRAKEATWETDTHDGYHENHNNPIIRLACTEIGHSIDADGKKKHLKDLYSFHPFPISEQQCEGNTIEELVSKQLAEHADENGIISYDLILLDLSLGERPGADPRGYQLLPLLRLFFPLLPIVVYSKYHDMGHIERAFRLGATWYLPKDEEHKLASHHMEVMDSVKWRREWNLLKHPKNYYGVNFQDWDVAHKYLAVKCLNHLPGHGIEFHTLTGGIGGSKTLLARRIYGDDPHRVQPLIVKIDDYSAMDLERERYQRFIAPYLCNHVGRIERRIVRAGSESALAYTFTGWSGISGKDHSNAKTVNLEHLIKTNLAGQDEDTIPFDRYQEFMGHIFERILPALHGVNPHQESTEYDYPNPVLKEYPEAVTHYLTRLMPSKSYELEGPLKPCNSSVGSPRALHEKCEKQGMKLIFLESHKANGVLRCLTPVVVNKNNNLLRRVDLVGARAQFYARFRHFHKTQLFVADRLAKTGAEPDAWKNLWAGKREIGSGESWKKLFANSPFTKDSVQRLPEDVVKLTSWLSSEKVRGTLNNGRVGILHGDMNVGNIMAQQMLADKPLPMDNMPWLIDFAETRRDRIVYDFTQFEVDWFSRTIRPEYFFPAFDPDSTELSNDEWRKICSYFQVFLDAPHKLPSVAHGNKRLAFLYEGMGYIRNAALKANVGNKEYLYSRVLALLIVHKINAKRIGHQSQDQQFDLGKFISQLTLYLAFQTAKKAGFGD